MPILTLLVILDKRIAAENAAGSDAGRRCFPRKISQPEAIVKAVLGLLDNDFITGETVRVDGGRHLS